MQYLALITRLKRAWTTSSSRGRAHKKELSSAKTTRANRLSNTSSIGEAEVENSSMKWNTKFPPIAALLDTQAPSFVLRKFTAFDILLIRVEV